MGCKNCANRRSCNRFDRARGEACKDYMPDKMKKVGFALMAAGALGLFVIAASEFGRVSTQFLVFIIDGLVMVIGALLMGDELYEAD